MPPLLKLGALTVSIMGLLIALDLSSLVHAQFKTTPNLAPHKFSTITGFFPAINHRLTPKLSLTFGQTIASQTLDLTWLELVGPKIISTSHTPAIKFTSESQQGLIKTYITFFLISSTLVIALVLF